MLVEHTSLDDLLGVALDCDLDAVERAARARRSGRSGVDRGAGPPLPLVGIEAEKGVEARLVNQPHDGVEPSHPRPGRPPTVGRPAPGWSPRGRRRFGRQLLDELSEVRGARLHQAHRPLGVEAHRQVEGPGVGLPGVQLGVRLTSEDLGPNPMPLC